MPSSAILANQGRELTQKLANFEADESMSADDKEAAFKTLSEEFETWEAAMERSEAASNMNSKLAGFGDAKDVRRGPVATDFELPSQLNNRGIKALSTELMEQGDDLAKVFEAKSGHRQKYDLAWELGLKTNGVGPTAAANLIGEGLFGASGPSAAGQNPFLAGAFGPGIQPQWLPGIVEQLFYELTIADLISSFSTTAPQISYLTESLANFQAAPTAESALYPWSSEEFSRIYAQVGKIANAMTLSDEAIADAPTLFNFVQGRLLYGLQRQEELQILAGAGYPGVGGLLGFASSFTASSAGSIFGATSATGTNVVFPPTGTVGIGAQGITVSSLAYGRKVTGASGVYPTAVNTALEIKDAFVDIELSVFKKPNAVIANPRDWQLLDTAQDANGQFYNLSFFGSNYGVGGPHGKSLWGVPVITTPLIPKGTILTGYFDPSTVQIARREGVSMQMTNSNGTDFVQGNVTVRAEERLGLLCYRPAAFQLINLVAGA